MTPFQLLWEASSHMLQLMREGTTGTHLYSRVNWSNVEWEKTAQGFNTAAQVSNPKCTFTQQTQTDVITMIFARVLVHMIAARDCLKKPRTTLCPGDSSALRKSSRSGAWWAVNPLLSKSKSYASRVIHSKFLCNEIGFF